MRMFEVLYQSPAHRPRSRTCVAYLLALLAWIAVPAHAQEQTWRINIKNADLNEFVMQVAEITGKTFVVDPRIKGNVTVVSSTPMNREAVYELFLSVLRVHNWTAVHSGGVIRIQQNATAKQSPGAEGDLSAIPPEELVTRVVSAQNVDSAELVKILRPLIPQYGHIAAVADPNVVIISDHADNIVRLVRLIQQVDVVDEDEVVVVPLREAWVGNVVALLEKVAPDQLAEGAVGPQRVQIIANERNNTLVVRGKPRPVAQILKLVEQLDQPATAIGATQVIYLRHGDAAKLAPMLEEMIAGKSKEGEEGPTETAIRADESLNAIIVRGDPSIMGEVREILDKLDVRRTQVLIEAAIVEISMDDSTDIGVEMAGVDRDGNTVPFFNTTLDGVVSSLIQSIIGEDGEVDVLPALGSATAPTMAVAKIDPNGFSFAAVVRALATNTNANLLSTPSILTLDNQEAKIVVGNEVPFRTGSYATNTGDSASNPFTTIQREDVGLQLTVTPHVHDGTSVRLVVAQEITNIVPEAPIGNEAFSDVVTSKRTIETTVLAEDRQTIVLGGLIQDDMSDTVKKVPFLGSIPAIGRLFRSDSKSRTKRNLLVFLRPTVIKNADDAKDVTENKYKDVWEVELESSGTGLTPEDLFRGRP
jgi:general secretion pathway protein D